MKTKIFFLSLCLMAQAFSFAQWSNLDEPEFRRGNILGYIKCGDDMFVNTGLSIFKYNISSTVWEYAGNNLIDQYPYQYCENFFVYNENLYIFVRNHILKYDGASNSWIEQTYTLPETLPVGYEVKLMGATDGFLYAIITYGVGPIELTQIYYANSFDTWNPGLTQDDGGLYNYTINVNKHFIAWASNENYVLFTSDAITWDTLEFGSVPMRPSPDEWGEDLVGESTGDFIFYQGPDDRMYRYTISEDMWDTIHNNFQQPTNIVGFSADDGLLVCTAIGMAGLVPLGSFDGGENFFSMAGQMGPVPFINKVTHHILGQYWMSNITSDVLYSSNSGITVDFNNDGFNAGLNYIVDFDNKVYSFVTGYGVYKADPNDLSFVADNAGTSPFMGMRASIDMYSTGSRLYYSYIEDITTHIMGLYYKDGEENLWTKITSITNLIDVKFLGHDAIGNLYVILTQQEGKANVSACYRIEPDLTTTALTNFPGLANGTSYNIVAGNNNEIYFFFINDVNLAMIYRSDDEGDTWTDLGLDFANFAYVVDFKKIDGSYANVSSVIDADGNLVFMMRTIFGLPVNYENIIVKYNPVEDSFSQLEASGFIQEMLYSCSLAYSQIMNKYFMSTPVGFYMSDVDFNNWMLENEYEGYRLGIVSNGMLIYGNRVVFSTICNGLWFTDFFNNVNLTEQSKLQIYPNPASESITINGLQQGDKISIVNSIGKQLFTETSIGESLSIETKTLPSGVYMVRIVGNFDLRYAKFIKE